MIVHSYSLYSNGADIHHVDPAGQSAFHWAMKTPNIECLKLLCKFINSPVMVNQPVSLNLSSYFLLIIFILLMSSSYIALGQQWTDSTSLGGDERPTSTRTSISHLHEC